MCLGGRHLRIAYPQKTNRALEAVKHGSIHQATALTLLLLKYIQFASRNKKRKRNREKKILRDSEKLQITTT